MIIPVRRGKKENGFAIFLTMPRGSFPASFYI